MAQNNAIGPATSQNIIREQLDKENYKKTIKACGKAVIAVQDGWKVGNRYDSLLRVIDFVRSDS